MSDQSDFIDELLEAVFLSESNSAAESDLPTVCFTGKMPEKRSYYEELARTKGFQAVDSVSKELGLLVAADLNSGSSKLTKAAKLGIKVMALDEFLKLEDNQFAEPSIEAVPEPEKVPEVPVADELPLFAEEPVKKADGKPEQLSFGF